MEYFITTDISIGKCCSRKPALDNEVQLLPDIVTEVYNSTLGKKNNNNEGREGGKEEERKT